MRGWAQDYTPLNYETMIPGENPEQEITTGHWGSSDHFK